MDIAPPRRDRLASWPARRTNEAALCREARLKWNV